MIKGTNILKGRGKNSWVAYITYNCEINMNIYLLWLSCHETKLCWWDWSNWWKITHSVIGKLILFYSPSHCEIYLWFALQKTDHPSTFKNPIHYPINSSRIMSPDSSTLIRLCIKSSKYRSVIKELHIVVTLKLSQFALDFFLSLAHLHRMFQKIENEKLRILAHSSRSYT